MQDFVYRGGELFVEDLSLRQVADSFGTPAYVYSRAALTRNYRAYAEAMDLARGRDLVCYAVKANSNLAVLQILADLGAGFDIVSVGELERVLRAGGDPARIVFSGVGKQADEMARALDIGVHCFNIESEAELEVLARVAAQKNRTANLSVRVNPDVDAKTHPYISTGMKENKFGIDIARAREVYAKAAQLPSVTIKGIDCHIGSQLTDLAPYLDALERVLRLVDELLAAGVNIEHLDLGGGLGVTYREERPPAPADFVRAVKKRLGPRRLNLILEPGRSIAANAGVLLTRVIYLKPTAHQKFAIIDAAMNDNIRPSLYQAWQNILPLTEAPSLMTGALREPPGETQVWDLVGPVCESADVLAKERELTLKPGDYLALMSSGAYGFVMSSNYNSRGRAAEIMVDGQEMHLVRRRETWADLIRGETLLPGISPSSTEGLPE